MYIQGNANLGEVASDLVLVLMSRAGLSLNYLSGLSIKSWISTVDALIRRFLKCQYRIDITKDITSELEGQL